MGDVTRRIGLSLGADLCWPICYEELLRRLDLALDVEGDTVRFEVERITIEPFDLRQPCRYDLVVDRLTHWYTTSREWIKKAVIMDGLYVFNNPWAIQSMEKHTSYAAMMRLGLPIPATWMVPTTGTLIEPFSATRWMPRSALWPWMVGKMLPPYRSKMRTFNESPGATVRRCAGDSELVVLVGLSGVAGWR